LWHWYRIGAADRRSKKDSKKDSSMKRAARILAVLGAALGVGFAYIGVFVAGPPVGLGVRGRGWLLFLGLAAMLLAILAGWMSVVIARHPRFAGTVILIAGLVGFVCIAYYWLVPALLLLPSAGLALGTPLKPRLAEGQ
jgi:hypothetical protein